MSSVTDVSRKLGDYMLKGWVLTDTNCPTKGCKIPLLRSPSRQTPTTHFCANCEKDTTVPETSSSAPSITPSSPRSGRTHESRSSTPLTELSGRSSSPEFTLPPETPETLRRRQQSDQASAEIGKRLLQGWAMLADECPQSTCYGVPLVRPPKAGGGKDTRKECVVCRSVFVDQTDASGFNQLVPFSSVGTGLAEQSAGPGPSNQPPWADKETGVTGANEPAMQATVPISSSLQNVNAGNTSRKITSADMYGGLPLQNELAGSEGAAIQSPGQHVSSSGDALATTVDSLERSLRALSRRLNKLSDALMVDPAAVSATADAIVRVTQALAQVKQLRWNDAQASMS